MQEQINLAFICFNRKLLTNSQTIGKKYFLFVKLQLCIIVDDKYKNIFFWHQNTSSLGIQRKKRKIMLIIHKIPILYILNKFNLCIIVTYINL